jgi:hypothetical protein
MAGATTGRDDERVRRDGAEQGRIDAMQRSLTRLHGDIDEQQRAVAEGQRDVAERQGDVAKQQRDVAVSERFGEDLQRNIDGAQGRLDHPGADEAGPAPTPGPTRRPDPAGPKAEPPA